VDSVADGREVRWTTFAAQQNCVESITIDDHLTGVEALRRNNGTLRRYYMLFLNPAITFHANRRMSRQESVCGLKIPEISL
jgi:tryptophan synthase alpha subunit